MLALMTLGGSPGGPDEHWRSEVGPSGAVRAASLKAERIAAAYTVLQTRNGGFPDYVRRLAPGRFRNRYGPAVMGGALVSSGVRNGRPGILKAGLRSLRLALVSRSGLEKASGKGRTRKTFEYPFSMLGIVEARRALRSERGRKALARLGRADRRTVSRMRLEIARLAPIPPRADRIRWGEGQNRLLLERLVWLEALASGIGPAPRAKGGVLQRPGSTRSRVTRFLTRWLEGRPRGMPRGDPTGPLLLASDSPRWPLAYHALSAGLLARALPFTSGPLRAVAGGALRDAVRATRFLMAPDGDIAYVGRSTMQVWTLSMAAYAALATARVPGVLPEELAANRELARLLIDRVGEAHLRADARLMIAPGLNPSPGRGVEILDRYASEIPYAGLALLALEWAAGEQDGPSAPIAPASRHAWPERGGASFVTSRSGTLWMALRTESPNPADRRLDFGPVAAKQQRGRNWEWLVPPRPPDAGRGPDSWIEVRSGDRRILPVAARMFRRSGDWVHVVGFGEKGSSPEQEIEFVYRAADCGGLEIEVGPLATTTKLGFWLPGERTSIEADRAGTDEVGLTVSRPTDIEGHPDVPGPSHQVLSPVSLSVGPHDGETAVTLCLVE
jgi:hypothetical protein